MTAAPATRPDAIDPATLPAWDLSDLFPGRDSPQLDRALSEADTAARAFHKAHQGKVEDLDGPGLADAIAEYERIDEVLSRAMSYASLEYAGDVSDPQTARFYQSMQERVNGISTHLVFFALEINRIDDRRLDRLMKAEALRRWGPWLRDLRAFRPHQLSDELERMLHERNVVGRAAWNRLFDERIASLRFPLDGRELPISDALDRLSRPDPEVRRTAAEAIGKVLGENARTFALVTNTLAKDKEIEDRWRGYARPVSARNLSNRVEDGVVDALAAAVRAAYPDLSHRYYRLKARWFGRDRLDYWDRNAPLPDDDDRLIGWDDARSIVLGAYARFSPELAEVGARFFDRHWIDAAPRPGKSPGAFAHPTVPSAHPYLLLNYHGRVRDVMTLAHELGHGVHQVLAGGQGHFLSDTPLTLAETASVFGEMLTFQALLAETTEPRRRRALLAAKVEDMLNTVVRQIAFYTFEERLHEARRKGELTADEIGDVWMSVQGESLGPAIRFDDAYRTWWAYIPHFIHTPFYVYAYAFGDCLVNSLYAVYRDAAPGFAEKYLDMLRAGGTKRHGELLAPFGLDASDPGFWSRGLGVIGGLVDELEAMG
jgi:oligoendopeptidase F